MKTSHLVYGGFAAMLLLNAPKISDTLVEPPEIAEVRAAAGDVRQSVNAEAREKAKSSGAAIAAVKTGCTPIVDTASGVPFPFAEGDTVEHRETGNLLPPGEFVCNAQGRVGVIGPDQRVETVVQASAEDMTEYLRFFYAIKTGQFDQLGAE